MSAVTLETLRADFQAARQAVWLDFKMYAPYGEGVWGKVTDFAFLTIMRFAPASFFAGTVFEAEDELDVAVREAATRLQIARKCGLKGLALWKLSDGQIDPRKGGDA